MINQLEKYWYSGAKPSKTDFEKKKLGKEAELYAKEAVLPKLGFNEILYLNEEHRNGKIINRQFTWDFYAEKDGYNWFIDVTTYVHKKIHARHLMPVWKKLGVKLGVLFVKPDFSNFVFKESGYETYVKVTPEEVGVKNPNWSEVGKKAHKVPPWLR